MASLAFGLVRDLLGSFPPRPGDPSDADAEFAPGATLAPPGSAVHVRPDYCYQTQLLEGTVHLRVPIERGMELFRGMRGRTSGFAIPQYVLDTPHGKVPLAAPSFRGREADEVVVEAWDGHRWRERNPLEP